MSENKTGFYEHKEWRFDLGEDVFFLCEYGEGMVIVEECRENPRTAELRKVDGKWQYASAYDRKQMIEYGDETQANQLLEFFNSNPLPEECA